MVITKVVAGKLPPLRRAIAEAKAAAHQLAYYDLRILMETLEDYEGEWQLAVYTVLVEGYMYYHNGRLYRRDIRPLFVVDAVRYAIRRGIRCFDDALVHARESGCVHAERALGRVVAMGYGDVHAIAAWGDLFLE